MTETAKRRILVIDDEEDIRALLKGRLEGNGYEVLLAEDGHKGMQLAREQKSDLILLDIRKAKKISHTIAKSSELSCPRLPE